MGKEARSEPGFFQIILVLAFGAWLLLYLSGRARGSSSIPGKSVIDSIVGTGGENDKLGRQDRKELDDLLNKVGN